MLILQILEYSIPSCFTSKENELQTDAQNQEKVSRK